MSKSLHIIKKSIAGDSLAQRALYEEYRTQWFMTSMRYSKSKMEAEDIFQEALVNIFNRLKSYDPAKGAFSTWSTRVLINSTLTYLKKNSWAASMAGLENSYHLELETEDIHDRLSAKELTLLVQALPVGYRLVFNMYAIEGFPHKEIAEELGITVGTSKSQLFKARKELKRQLELQLTSSSHE